jgi:hypothetical protein
LDIQSLLEFEIFLVDNRIQFQHMSEIYFCYVRCLVQRVVNYCFVQCVCDWEDRESKFMEVEGILQRQIKVAFFSFSMLFCVLLFFPLS